MNEDFNFNWQPVGRPVRDYEAAVLEESRTYREHSLNRQTWLIELRKLRECSP